MNKVLLLILSFFLFLSLIKNQQISNNYEDTFFEIHYKNGYYHIIATDETFDYNTISNLKLMINGTIPLECLTDKDEYYVQFENEPCLFIREEHKMEKITGYFPTEIEFDSILFTDGAYFNFSNNKKPKFQTTDNSVSYYEDSMILHDINDDKIAFNFTVMPMFENPKLYINNELIETTFKKSLYKDYEILTMYINNDKSLSSFERISILNDNIFYDNNERIDVYVINIPDTFNMRIERKLLFFLLLD